MKNSRSQTKHKGGKPLHDQERLIRHALEDIRHLDIVGVFWHLWPYLGISWRPWPFYDFSGRPWTSLGVPWRPWSSMGIYGSLRVLGFLGSLGKNKQKTTSLRQELLN